MGDRIKRQTPGFFRRVVPMTVRDPAMAELMNDNGKEQYRQLDKPFHVGYFIIVSVGYLPFLGADPPSPLAGGGLMLPRNSGSSTPASFAIS